MRCRIAALAAAFLVLLGTDAQSADINLGPMVWTGIPAIFVKGTIVPGDEQKFATVAAKRQALVVVLDSPGGNIDAAIAIGRIVRNFKLDTFIGRRSSGTYGCMSACPLIWFSGRHAIIQRNSYLGFHAANIPEGTAEMQHYLSELGLTALQINYLLSTPQSDIWLASEAAARMLGFRPQVVSSLFGAWQNCQAKYCLAVP